MLGYSKDYIDKGMVTFIKDTSVILSNLEAWGTLKLMGIPL